MNMYEDFVSYGLHIGTLKCGCGWIRDYLKTCPVNPIWITSWQNIFVMILKVSNEILFKITKKIIMSTLRKVWAMTDVIGDCVYINLCFKLEDCSCLLDECVHIGLFFLLNLNIALDVIGDNVNICLCFMFVHCP